MRVARNFAALSPEGGRNAALRWATERPRRLFIESCFDERKTKAEVIEALTAMRAVRQSRRRKAPALPQLSQTEPPEARRIAVWTRGLIHFHAIQTASPVMTRDKEPLSSIVARRPLKVVSDALRESFMALAIANAVL